jgi:hypothetical protein
MAILEFRDGRAVEAGYGFDLSHRPGYQPLTGRQIGPSRNSNSVVNHVRLETILGIRP